MTNHTAVIPSLAFDEARAFAEQAEQAHEAILKLHADRYASKATIAAAYDRLRQALKLAEVHSNLAIAEEIRHLREDLADDPIPYVPTEAARVVTFPSKD